MPTLNIDEVQLRLPQIIDELHPGDELVITRGNQAIARLLPAAPPPAIAKIGRGKDMLVAYTDDEEHLQDFAEYMS